MGNFFDMLPWPKSWERFVNKGEVSKTRFVKRAVYKNFSKINVYLKSSIGLTKNKARQTTQQKDTRVINILEKNKTFSGCMYNCAS